MKAKIRRIYKGTQTLDKIEIPQKELLKIIVTDNSKTPYTVYTSFEEYEVTIKYGTYEKNYTIRQGDSLKNIYSLLDESEINTAEPGSSFLKWYIISGTEETYITPDSINLIADSLKDIVINSDTIIQALYSTDIYTLTIYDYDHSTYKKEIKVAYNTTYEEALTNFDISSLTLPSDAEPKLYNYIHKGWSLTKNNLYPDDILTQKITSDTSIYPILSIGDKINYTLKIHKYNYTDTQFDEVGSIKLYYDESYSTAISRTVEDSEEDILASINTYEDLGEKYIIHTTDYFYLQSDINISDTPGMSITTTLANVPESILNTYLDKNTYTINVYLGYSEQTKKYKVTLYDKVTNTYLYQNTNVIHNSILENLENLSTYIMALKANTFKSSGEEEHYDYTYTLTCNNTLYDFNVNHTVTATITLVINYTKTPTKYTVFFNEQVTTTNLDGTITTSNSHLYNIEVTYNTAFTIPEGYVDLLNSTIVKAYENGTKETITYSSKGYSNLDNSRQFTTQATFTCIGNETFCIDVTKVYSEAKCIVHFLDNSKLNPNDAAFSYLIEIPATDYSSFKTTIQGWSSRLGESYEDTSGLFWYNSIKTLQFVVKYHDTDKQNITKTFTTTVEKLNNNDYSDIPSTIYKYSEIIVSVQEVIQNKELVTVTWKATPTNEVIKTSSDVQKGTRYMDLEYPTEPTISDYTFTYWSPVKTSSYQILEDTIITAEYSYNYAGEDEDEDDYSDKIPTYSCIYIDDPDKIFPVLTTLYYNENTKTLVYDWIEQTIDINSFKKNDSGNLIVSFTVNLIRPSNLSESYLWITYKDGSNTSNLITIGNLQITITPELIDATTDKLTFNLEASNLTVNESISFNLPLRISSRRTGLYDQHSDSAAPYITIKFTYKNPDPGSD